MSWSDESEWSPCFYSDNIDGGHEGISLVRLHPKARVEVSWPRGAHTQGIAQELRKLADMLEEADDV